MAWWRQGIIWTSDSQFTDAYMRHSAWTSQLQVVMSLQGYFLLYETMLPSVLYARDKWLKEVSLA